MGEGVIKMASSPAHRLGQFIGDFLENTMIRYCSNISQQFGMYLDYKHPRAARNLQSEVRWVDCNNNTHKLDIVIEKDGSEEYIGNPRAFIEIAWRRYTKHSKNKVQEISAAIMPLVTQYNEQAPFYGVVLAGEFTQNSITQLLSEGFKVLYFSIDYIEYAFMVHHLNIHWDEDTTEDNLKLIVSALERLSESELNLIGDTLINLCQSEWQDFERSLRLSLERTIDYICVTSTFGFTESFTTVHDVCRYLATKKLKEVLPQVKFVDYIINIRYNTGESINMRFKDNQQAIIWLNRFA